MQTLKDEPMAVLLGDVDSVPEKILDESRRLAVEFVVDRHVLHGVG